MIPLGLPEPTDWIEADVVTNVREHGWHVCMVHGNCEYCAEGDLEHSHEAVHHDDPRVDAAYAATFAYTVGLTPRFDHPEILLVGGWSAAGHFLNTVGDLVRDGHRFAPGDTSSEVLDGFVVRFDDVGVQPRWSLMTLAHWAMHRAYFDALQLVLPDRWGRWPEDPEYHGYPQPPQAD
jgi:hypothetical protein